MSLLPSPFSLTRDWSFRTYADWKTCWLWRQQTCCKLPSSLQRPCSEHMVCVVCLLELTFMKPWPSITFVYKCIPVSKCVHITSPLSQTGIEKNFWRPGCRMLKAAVSAQAWPCPPLHPAAIMLGTPCPHPVLPGPLAHPLHSPSHPPPTAVLHLARRAWLRWDITP